MLLLRARDDLDVDVVPGLSFADLAWTRLGVDPLAGARVVDARARSRSTVPAFAGPDAPRPVRHAARAVGREARAARSAAARARGRRAGSGSVFPTSTCSGCSWPSSIVQSCPTTSRRCFVDTGGVAVAGEFARLVALTERLRGPGGCPWDAEQTHPSLRRHVLEEAYEVAEAIEALPADAPRASSPRRGARDAYDALEDELGDLLFQVVIQSVLAAEAGAFTDRRRRPARARQARAPAPARVRRRHRDRRGARS